MAPEFDHLCDALDEAIVPIVAELRGRLEVMPSEKDWLAIDTALAKAALVGVKQGARELSEQVDEAIPPDAERQFATRMGATTTEIASSHVAMVSHPAEVAALVEKAAESVGVAIR